MDPTTRFIILAIVIAVSQSCLGVAVGWWLKERRVSGLLTEQQAGELLDQLQGLATDMVGDVGEHSSRMEEINQTLTTPPAGSNERPAEEAVFEAISQVVAANKGMQDKLQSAEKQIREQSRQIDHHLAEARIDPLTKLANRRAFDLEITRRFAERDRADNTFSLLLVDIDHFKAFNDQHGHAIGDDVLRHVAEVLASTMREMDLVARYGGEEFAVVLPMTDLEKGKRAAERAREAIARSTYRVEGRELQVTVSAGVAQVDKGDTPRLLLQRTDAALYAAKGRGRNCSFFQDGLSVRPVLAEESSAPETVDAPGASASGTKAVAKKPKRRPDESVDPLTGLPHRHVFCEVLREQILQSRAEQAWLSLLLIGLDQLNKIVLASGQATVDQHLCSVGELLTSVLGNDGRVLRYGWEEFAIIMPRADFVAATEMDKQVRAELADAVLPAAGQARVTISSGITELMSRDDVVSLMTRAEAALEASRANGGNCAHFHCEGARELQLIPA